MNEQKTNEIMTENDLFLSEDTCNQIVEELMEAVQPDEWVETEQSTIMDAFIYLTRDNEDAENRQGDDVLF